ncbi:hypothetical protein HDU97_002958 [Phlyctochytrium planicorne]|nr:hypothetical protein HDU97_002958 [Phlyctochytrium planicorne]
MPAKNQTLPAQTMNQTFSTDSLIATYHILHNLLLKEIVDAIIDVALNIVDDWRVSIRIEAIKVGFPFRYKDAREALEHLDDKSLAAFFSRTIEQVQRHDIAVKASYLTTSPLYRYIPPKPDPMQTLLEVVFRCRMPGALYLPNVIVANICHPKVVEYFESMQDAQTLFDASVMIHAAEKGQIDLIKRWYSKGVKIVTETWFRAMDVVRFLSSVEPPRNILLVMIQSALDGYQDALVCILSVMHERGFRGDRLENCVFRLVRGIAERYGDLSVVALLSEVWKDTDVIGPEVHCVVLKGFQQAGIRLNFLTHGHFRSRLLYGRNPDDRRDGGTEDILDDWYLSLDDIFDKKLSDSDILRVKERRKARGSAANSSPSILK